MLEFHAAVNRDYYLLTEVGESSKPRKGHDGAHHSADEIHAIHLASLNNEFCRVKSTAEVLGEHTYQIVAVDLLRRQLNSTVSSPNLFHSGC